MSAMRRRIGAGLSSLALVVMLVPIAAVPVAAADPVTVTFTYTGAEQSFVVPDDVTSVHAVVIGAPGGDYEGANNDGGAGAHVEGDLAVTPGATLYIRVGGVGADVASTGLPPPGGFNGGGAGGGCLNFGFWGATGGGASDIRTTSGSLASRLITAGGGGGAGDVADGGAAGQPGQGANAGGAGTASAGGAGGGGTIGIANGGNGVEGFGGAGATTNVGGCGAGGGGGHFGGGGGGADQGNFQTGGASGGGGSSSTGSATGASVTTDATGIPLVTISYDIVTDRTSVAADVTVPTSAACLELSTTSISFGTLPFGAENRQATPSVVVTNCSAEAATLLASGTNATGLNASWALVGGFEACASSLGLDRYRITLDGSTLVFPQSLTTDAAFNSNLPAGATSTQVAKIWMPCPGSTGGGQTMTMSINYLAVEQ